MVKKEEKKRPKMKHKHPKRKLDPFSKAQKQPNIIKEAVYNIHCLSYKSNRSYRQYIDLSFPQLKSQIISKRNVTLYQLHKIYCQFWRAVSLQHDQIKKSTSEISQFCMASIKSKINYFCQNENGNSLQEKEVNIKDSDQLDELELKHTQLEQELKRVNEQNQVKIKKLFKQVFYEQQSELKYQSTELDIKKDNILKQVYQLQMKLVAESIFFIQKIQKDGNGKEQLIAKFDPNLGLMDQIFSKQQLKKLNNKRSQPLFTEQQIDCPSFKYLIKQQTKRVHTQNHWLRQGYPILINQQLQMIQKLGLDYQFCHICCSVFQSKNYFELCGFSDSSENKVDIPLRYSQQPLSITNGLPMLLATIKRSPVPKSQIDLFSNYQGTKIRKCGRKYCLQCLNSIAEEKGKEFCASTIRKKLCIFCTKKCKCQRCLLIWSRSRLIFLYLKCHGSVQQLRKGSYANFLYKKQNKLILRNVLKKDQHTQFMKIYDSLQQNQDQRSNKLSFYHSQLKQISNLVLRREQIKLEISRLQRNDLENQYLKSINQ